jgi:hypothetical protein
MASPKISSSFPKECEKDCEAFLSTIENPIKITGIRAMFRNIVTEAIKGNKPSVTGHMGTLESNVDNGFALAAFYKGVILEMMKADYFDRKKASRVPARAPAPAPVQVQAPMQAQYAPRVQYVQQQQPQQQIQYIPVTQIPMSSAPDAQQQIQYIPVTQIPMSSASDAQQQIQYVQQPQMYAQTSVPGPIHAPMGPARQQFYGLPARR